MGLIKDIAGEHTPVHLPEVPIPIRNLLFLGRDDILLTIEEELTQNGRVALSGLGGVGKTQIALAYAYQYRPRYKTILWFDASERETLIASFVRAAQYLRLPVAQSSHREVVIREMYQWFIDASDWLLILDGADNLILLSEYMPPMESGHCIITTQAHATRRIASNIPIKPLSADMGSLLLFRRAGLLTNNQDQSGASLEERNAVAEIVALLDGLPLAIEQAGAYLEAVALTPTEFLPILQNRRRELLKININAGPHYHDSVIATFSLAMRRVQELNPGAADLLRLFSFCSPVPIPDELLTLGVAEADEALSQIAGDDIARHQLLGDLLKFSLISRDRNTRTLVVHRLVQEVVRHDIAESERQFWADRALQSIGTAFPNPSVHDKWELCDRLLPHALFCLNILADWNMDSFDSANLLNSIGLYLTQRGDFAAAEPLLRRSVSVLKEKDEDRSWLAIAYQNLSAVLRHRGHFVESEAFGKLALDFWETNKSADPMAIARALLNLAETYRVQARYREAEPLYERSLNIHYQQLSQDDIEVSDILNDMGELFTATGRIAKGLEYHEKALLIRQALPYEELRIATSQHNLASAYMANGELDKACELYKQALTLEEKILGTGHTDVAITLGNLGYVYLRLGKWLDARWVCRRAVKIYENRLGQAHLMTGLAKHNLAKTYIPESDLATAESLYREAVAIADASESPYHHETATILESLASFLIGTWREEEAIPLIKRAASIRARYT